MLLTLLIGLLKQKLSEEIASDVPVGGTMQARGVAHDLKLFGKRWSLDVVLKRTA